MKSHLYKKHFIMNQKLTVFLLFILAQAPIFQATGQEKQITSSSTLQDYIEYAWEKRGSIQQSIIDEEILDKEIASSLSGWFPQIGSQVNYSRNLIEQNNQIANSASFKHTGLVNIYADQNILDARLLQASKATPLLRQNASLLVELDKINTVVEVSKSYYDIITTSKQIEIIEENIQRIKRQLEDATLRYETGIVDKTDFKRAQISLANGEMEKNRLQEVLKSKYAYFAEIIGYSGTLQFEINMDDIDMENQIISNFETNPNYENRVELKHLLTVKEIQKVNTQYNKWSFLPSLSASYNYGWDFRKQEFNGFFNTHQPRSTFGVSLNFPIFQGGRRIHEIKKSKLQEERIDWDIINLKRFFNTEYEAALANYKASLYNFNTAEKTVEWSEEVYEIIKLQYNEGLKNYLELMTAENELKVSQINYLNSMYSVLSAKLDVEKSLGKITVN